MEGITKNLGKDIWRRAILVLTRSATANLPDGLEHTDFFNKRVKGLQRAIRQAGSPCFPPVSLIENLGEMQDYGGRPVILDRTSWLLNLMENTVKLVETAQCAGLPPYQYNTKLYKHSNPNHQLKWSIPLIIIMEYFLKVFVLERVLLEDGIRCNPDGPALLKKPPVQ